FTSYMRAKGLEVVSPYGLPETSGGVAYATAGGVAESEGAAGPARASESPQAAPAPADDKAASSDFSGTNVQEAGIDEPDVVKTDGKRIYALSNGRLYVVDAKDPKILGS